MPPVRVVIASGLKHHFWILCGLTVILAVVGWALAASKISAEFKEFSGTVKQRFNDASSVTSQRPHPNQAVIKQLQEETDELRDHVINLWQSLYDQQRKDVLHWPSALPEEFLEMIERREFGDDIDRYHCQTYQNFVKERFDELPKIVRAKAPDNNRRRPSEDEEVDPLAPEDLVDWSSANYTQLQSMLVWSNTPPPIKIWVTQENLWIYEALLEVIARTNIGVKARHEAVVSAINALDVGRDAAAGIDTLGRIYIEGRERVADPYQSRDGGKPVRKRAAPQGGSALPGLGGLGGFGGQPGGGVPMEPETSLLSDEEEIDPKALAEELLTDRYLDAQGKPLPPNRDPAAEEFKRVPIRMELMMHPRRIYQFLVECANAPLPVEIHQVRINSGATGSDRKRGESQDVSVGQRATHVPVVFQGIVYIFNPPNPDKLPQK